MADKIQIRGGNKSNMPVLTDRELGYVRDEKYLYIGTPEGNVCLNMQGPPGADGRQGADGEPGKDGEPGYSPVKGVDYWTEADKQDIVNMVIAQIGNVGVDLTSVFPVGSIYLSVVETNPATLFGFGAWEQIKDTFLLAAGSTYAAGSMGGDATHTLTVDELPEHDHATGVNVVGWPTTVQYAGDWGIKYDENDNTFPYTEWINQTLKAGGGQPHNNMPPYLAVYVWKRTA